MQPGGTGKVELATRSTCNGGGEVAVQLSYLMFCLKAQLQETRFYIRINQSSFLLSLFPSIIKQSLFVWCKYIASSQKHRSNMKETKVWGCVNLLILGKSWKGQYPPGAGIITIPSSCIHGVQLGPQNAPCFSSPSKPMLTVLYVPP